MELERFLLALLTDKDYEGRRQPGTYKNLGFSCRQLILRAASWRT